MVNISTIRVGDKTYYASAKVKDDTIVTIKFHDGDTYHSYTFDRTYDNQTKIFEVDDEMYQKISKELNEIYTD